MKLSIDGNIFTYTDDTTKSKGTAFSLINNFFNPFMHASSPDFVDERVLPQSLRWFSHNGLAGIIEMPPTEHYIDYGVGAGYVKSPWTLIGYSSELVKEKNRAIFNITNLVIKAGPSYISSYADNLYQHPLSRKLNTNNGYHKSMTGPRWINLWEPLAIMKFYNKFMPDSGASIISGIKQSLGLPNGVDLRMLNPVYFLGPVFSGDFYMQDVIETLPSYISSNIPYKMVSDHMDKDYKEIVESLGESPDLTTVYDLIQYLEMNSNNTLEGMFKNIAIR
jgi:hypothetical protein